MRFPFKRAMFGIMLVAMMMSGSAFLCDFWDPLTPAQQATLQADMCGSFKITSVTGLPYGPVTISWTKYNHSANPPTGYGYYYYVNMSEITTNPKGYNTSLISQVVEEPTTSLTVTLDAAKAKQAKADGGLYEVDINGAFSWDAKPADLFTDCFITMTINNSPVKQKKVSPQQLTPTATFQPVINPALLSTLPAPSITPTLPAPPKQPTIVVPTPCPAGQTGDPAHDIPCINVPR